MTHRVTELPTSSITHRRFRIVGPPAGAEIILAHPRLPRWRERPRACPLEGYEVEERLVTAYADHWIVDVVYKPARKVGSPGRGSDLE